MTDFKTERAVIPMTDTRAQEMVERLLAAAADCKIGADWHGNADDSDCEPHQSFQRDLIDGEKIAREAATLIASQAEGIEAARRGQATANRALAIAQADTEEEFAKRTAAEAALAKAGWQGMDSAPLDGKTCILSVPEGPFFYSVQGAFQNGQWNCVHRDNVKPVAWMPNVLLPDFIRTSADT